MTFFDTRICWVFWLFCLCCAARLSAQDSGFEQITIENGLPQGMVFDLTQTRDGFLWAGLEEALCRYDGYNFKHFKNNPRQPFSVAENRANVLLEDSRGWLWVGLHSKGVDLYDPKTGFFHHFSLGSEKNLENGSDPAVRFLKEAPDGAIWVLQANTKGLHRIAIPDDWKNGLPAQADLQALTTVSELLLPSNKTMTRYQYLMALLQFQPDGKLSVFCLQKKYVVDPQTLAVVETSDAPIPDNTIMLAQGDPAHDGDLWAANDHVLMRLRHGEVRLFEMPKSEQAERFALRPGKNGRVWLSYHHKMWELAPGEDFDPDQPDLLFTATPFCWNYDRAGNFWVGTMGYGLRKINPLQKLFHAGAQGSPLNGVWANKGQYFTKDFFNIRRYDPKTRKIASQLAFLDAPNKQIDLAFEPSGAVWLLCDADGKPMLRRYASGTSGAAERVFTFDAVLDPANPLVRTPDGRLWVAAESNTLVRFDPASEQFEYFSFAHVFLGKGGKERVLAFAQDANGVVWVGTERGLVKGKPNAQGFDFQLIKTDEPQGQAFSHNNIACLLPDPTDPDGTLWIATKGGGIKRMDTRTGQSRQIGIADGLLDEVVYAILPGNRAGEFWCSTNRGLAKITVQNGGDPWVKINTFTAKMGLQNNEFNTRSFFKADNGELLFGGVNGLNRFFPEEIRYKDTLAPPVFVVGLEINHRKVEFGDADGFLKMSIENLRELHLTHDQNNLSFEFAVLDFADPSKNSYRYRLVGLDKNWVETGKNRLAQFNHLPPGRYELRVQGNNGESAWGESQPLVIIVHPPWWRSDLAYLCYVLLLAWAGWRGYQFQIQRIKMREQLAFEQRETERVKALEQMKTNFFSNVTHEFRTPLTLMIEPLRRVLPKIEDPEILENVRLAERNSRQLLALVNQLLDMAKLESGQMSLDLRRANFWETVRGVFERFLPLAEKRGVDLTLKNVGRVQNPSNVDADFNFDFDPNKVELILNNLISNALKFTPEGGSVVLNVGRVQNPSNVEAVEIRVADSGIGIPAEVLDKIFDRFYQVDPDESGHTRAGEGTGIGLALSKELAELMGGGIAVESELGTGSVFTFWLPFASVGVTQSHPDTSQGSPPSAVHRLPSAVHRPPSAELPVVLVIEDNAELRNFIKKSIGAGWQVIEATDGEEGVKKALELLPDLVVSDVMMPRKDGFEVVDELKNAELTAHIPIILLTAKSGIESRLAGLQRGADDYLTKPFSTEELLVRMENLVETRRSLRQLFGKQPVFAPNEREDELPKERMEEPVLSAPDRDFLQKFNLLIEQHLDDEHITVEDFAHKMAISRMQLHRKLTALTDQNVTVYVRNYRLERAMRLLQNREGNVSEVAARVGFGSEKYFSTAFKEKFGVSPSQV